MTTETVIDATDATFQAEVLDRSHQVPVVVDFWAEWCGPCRVLGPVLEQVAAELGDAVQLVKLDTDANQRVAAQYGIRSIPAVKAFRDGVMVDEFVGALPEPEVRAFFDRIRPTEADALTAAGEAALGAGDLAAAQAQFEAALAINHAHADATIGLAIASVEQGNVDRAEELALRVPAQPRAARVLARVNLLRAAVGIDRAALEDRLAANEADLDAHYQLGAHMLAVGEWEPGFEHLLEVLIRDRKFADDGARRRFIEGLDLLGAAHPVAVEYLRRLTNVLF
ncbi:MAG: thioredoxin [Chloroflexi bacterium]|nr:thioredoxin [Chloroflexota bacterium]MDA1146143.1 thioredoxin [Chloroflexota bacterium]